MVMMTDLPEGWESDYDGTRWFFRYKATGSVQYHFPQPGDEYAEFLLDAGIGPFQLTPEENLLVDQQTKRRSISELDNGVIHGTKTSGSNGEKKKIPAIDEEDAMSATGYFDPNSFMNFSGAYNNNSTTGGNDAEGAASGDKTNQGHTGVAGNGDVKINTLTSNARPAAAELPEGNQQMWTPVGFVAELATQDTVKCAEELAPIELDATTSFTPAPIQTTKILPEPAELPTHRTPVEEKAPELKPTQPVMQPADSYPLVSASFAYPPLKPDMNRINSVSSRTSSIRRKPVSSVAKPVDPGQNKYQPYQPTQGVVGQQHQADSKAPETLPQTSVLQNQDSELGGIGRKNSGNAESPLSGEIPSTLAPPSAPNKPIPVESSNSNIEASPVPTVLQPAQHQTVSPETTTQHYIPGTQARHDSISGSIASHDLSYTPSVLKPGSSQTNSSLQESEGSPKPKPQHSSGQYPQQSAASHRLSGQAVPSNFGGGQPGITRVNTLPGHLPSASPSPPKMTGSPGFLFFHEITSTPNTSTQGTPIHAEGFPKPTVVSNTPTSNLTNLQSPIHADEQMPVVAPLNFIKRHSSKSSEVSSIISETQDSGLHSGKPALAPADEISEVISVINSFTPQGTPEPSSQPSRPPTQTAFEGSNKPNPTPVSEGMGGRPNITASAKPQLINGQSPSLAVNIQQSGIVSQAPQQVPPAVANVFKPASVAATPVAQSTVTSSPSNGVIAPTQNRPPNSQAAHYPHQPVQGSQMQNSHSSPSPPSQLGNLGMASMSPAPVRPSGHASNPSVSQMPAAVGPHPPPSQTGNITHTNQPHQPGPHGNFPHYINNPSQQPQANMPTSTVNRPPQVPVTAPAQQTLHQPQGQGNASPHSVVRPPTVGHPQIANQNPNWQQPATTASPGHQSNVQPLVGYPPPLPSPPQHQQASPAMQPVSPLQSQVSSPAQSIASLHVSQSSTPSNAFATMNTLTGPNNGANPNTNHTTTAPVRPPSMPSHAFAQQTGNVKPPTHSYTIPPPPANPPAKPYPMLPGQVTPLPSQVGSNPTPLPTQQPMPNNYAKPAVNMQHAAVGQQPTQATPGGPTQQHGMQFQHNPTMYSPQAGLAYGAVSSPVQMKPPQQQTPQPHPGQTHVVGQQTMANQPHQQQTMFYQPQMVPGQPQKPQMTMSSPVAGSPMVGQQQFAPPPMAQQQQQQQQFVQRPPGTAVQGKPFTSAQATAALSDAGKGMKKWAKKMLKNPALKQTAVGFGGAVMAESMGVSGAAGAQLASKLYASTNRPPLAHAQTAPPQAQGIPGAAPQHQQMPVGQQYQPGKPQQPQPQPAYHPGHPQPGYPQPGQLQSRPPQQGYPQPGHPQPGHPQPGHPQPGHPQPGHPQPVRPQSIQPQPGHPQPGPPQPSHPQMSHPQPLRPQSVQPQSMYSQPMYQPVGIQTPGQPHVVQNPTLAAGVGVNFNAQAQAQITFNPQQQYTLTQPVMVGNFPPPPPFPPAPVGAAPPSNDGPNIDPNVAAAAASVINTAINAAFRPDHSQPQHAQGNAHGYAQPEHTAHAESHGAGNHGYAAENHAGAQEQAAYTDNSYAATDTTYVDNSSYSVNNTYVDNTDTANNTVYMDNSSTVVADPTYSNASYVDTTSYTSADVTTNITVDVDVNSTYYADTGVSTFSVDETISVTETTDVTGASVDYSGGDWGDFS